MKDLVAEFVGTFALVFIITATIAGTLAFTGSFGALNLIAVALAAGIVLMALVYAFGSISGAHFNPAVTIGLLIAKQFPSSKVIAYLLAQFAGGIAAALVVWLLTAGATTGATTVGRFGTISAGVFEVVATGLFMLVILLVTHKKALAPAHAGIAIGGYLLVAHLAGIPFSGASLNPARSLGPALLGGGVALSQVWIYLLAPTIGAILGALVFSVFTGKSKD
ncbi:MAG: aquaporin [Candidatus Diapherotrites archaeon]|nr:aquaporin [Candidatus Diapherotrites archaeon]